MKAKIRVYGKSQSRTALGIINAYLKLYPDSTLSDLQRAFPGSLNPKSFTENIIVPVKETQGQEKQFFEREDEQVVLKNGQRLSLVEVWRKEDYDAIAEHAKQYGIVVAEIEDSKPFEKGSYELEYLDDFVPPTASPLMDSDSGNKKKNNWWWLLLLLLVLLLLLLLWKKCCSGDKCSTSNVVVDSTAIVAPKDTVALNVDTLANGQFKELGGDSVVLKLPDGQELRLDKNEAEFKLFSFLNSPDSIVNMKDKTKGWMTMGNLSFETGKSVLTPESDAQLKMIVAIMKCFPVAEVKIGGYTDNTGTEAINKKLSADRAKSTAEKMIALGVEANRITHEGYGSQYPVCPANDTEACKAANRRIDIRVTKK